MLNIALPGSPGAAVYQDYYKGHYKKENGCTCNNVIKIQIPVAKKGRPEKRQAGFLTTRLGGDGKAER
jgi:hypothetical protein